MYILDEIRKPRVSSLKYCFISWLRKPQLLWQPHVEFRNSLRTVAGPGGHRDENWRRLGTLWFSGAGGVPGRRSWEWRDYPWEQHMQQLQKAWALLEYQISQRDRKCHPFESLSVEVKTVWMGLGGGAWRATLSQDFGSASMVKIWTRSLLRAIAISVSCYSPLNTHFPVRDFSFLCTALLPWCLYLLPFS